MSNPADRPTTEPRTEAGKRHYRQFSTYGHRGQLMQDILAIEAEAAALIGNEYAAANLVEAAQGAAPLQKGIPNQPTDEMKGMCAIEQRCPLPKGHKGPHEWGGPPGWRGAAPRAEGLDVERLARAKHSVKAHSAPLMDCWRCNGDAENEAAEYARLSRPSDERVGEGT